MALDQDKRTILTQYLQAEYSVARALAEATSLPEAARLVLQALCQSLDWSSGAVWIVDGDERLITCLEVFQSPTGKFPDFINATRTMRFEPGIGLPGRVWAQGSPAWITDTLKDDNFPRIKVAAKDGLHGAVGFPILLGTQVFGVIELLSTEIRQPDPDLLATMTTICSQVAQFVKRDQAQQQLQQRIDHLQSIHQINDAAT